MRYPMAHCPTSFRQKYVAQLAALMVMLFAPVTRPAGADKSDEAADALAGRDAEVRRIFEFDRWRGLDKMPGYGLSELPDVGTFLLDAYVRVDVLGSHVPTSRRASVNVFPEKGGRTRTTVRIEVCDSASQAKEHLLGSLGASSAPLEVLQGMTAGPRSDIGDVAFLRGGAPPRAAYFVRSNVFVSVMASISDGDPKVLDIARDVDGILAKHLRQITFPLPMEEPPEPSAAATSPASRELSEALASGNIDVLARYAVGFRATESDRAVSALAASVEGREALFKLLSSPETDKLHARLILAALGNAGTPDAIDYVQRYAQSTESPKLYGSAIEATAKAMPPEQSRELCLAEARKLAKDLDASAERLTFVVNGLGPRLMMHGDPEETVVLRAIVERTHNAELRRASLKVLAAWVTEGSDLCGEILKVVKVRLTDADPRVRSCAARTVGRSLDPRSLPLLLPLLDDPDGNVRDSAIEAISTLLRGAIPAWTDAPVQKPSSDDIKARLQPVLQALKTLDEASRSVQMP